jgi:hypothetical protein
MHLEGHGVMVTTAMAIMEKTIITKLATVRNSIDNSRPMST